MKLTLAQRWILSNQYRILETLKHPDAETFSHIREALESGYELDYPPDYIYAGDNLMSEEECREVLVILTMHRALKYSYEALKDKSGIEPRDIRFAGFDGNNEAKHLGYMHYLGDDLQRFKELDRGDDFNSHMPMLPVYRRMLTVWRRLDERFELTKDDIDEIVSARPYPKEG